MTEKKAETLRRTMLHGMMYLLAINELHAVGLHND
jgi:hypothetical protein